MEVVDGERDDDDERQDEAQNEGEGLLQALPLVHDAFVGCDKRKDAESACDDSRFIQLYRLFFFIAIRHIILSLSFNETCEGHRPAGSTGNDMRTHEGGFRRRRGCNSSI